VLPSISEYLELYLNSPAHGQAQYRNWIYGEGRPHLGFEHLRATAIALPSLEEQLEIVHRIEILFKLADKIEKRVEMATKRADRITQAVLAKAFRGELVPTEAELARSERRDYEPASILLERVKAQRNITVASKNGHRRRS
jgi:type I restriction enzyme S subunit